jgi:hypothetical protein
MSCMMITYWVAVVLGVGGIVNIPPPTELAEAEAIVSYQQLKCTPEDRENITVIISTLADNGKLALLFQHKAELTRRGVEIAHVHPLKFLGVIFSDPNLKECMRKIFPDYFKRTKFMQDLSAGLNSRMDRGQIEPYLEEFSKEVSVPVELLRGYAQTRDWDGFMECLMNN